MCIMYVVAWHANDGMNIIRGCLAGCMGGCECKLNANVFGVDWNGTML